MLLKRELVHARLSAADAEGVLRTIAQGFVDAGYARPSYPQAVIDRERAFPTGLPAQGTDVALPHADCGHVHETSIAIATLAEPVAFTMMGTTDVRLAVRVVFMLGIAEAHAQVEMLQRLMGLLREGETLKELCACPTADEVYGLMAGRIGAGVRPGDAPGRPPGA